MRHVFDEKSCTECGGEICPRSFLEKLKLSISLDQKFYSLFLLYAKLRAIEIY